MSPRASLSGVVSVVVVVLVAAWAVIARAGPPPRVLPPEASGYFQKLLPGPGLSPEQIEILRDYALFRFVRGDAVVEVELREASTCAEPAGALCLHVAAVRGPGADDLATAAVAAVDRAARADHEGSPWVAPGAPRQGRDAPPPRAVVSGQPVWLIGGQAFLVLLLAGCLVAAWRSRRALDSRGGAICVGLFVGGLVIRLGAHAMPADVRDVLGTAFTFEARRAGWTSFIHLLLSVLPPTHETVWNVNRVLGALAVPLLYLAVRARFTELAATAAAAGLAVLPLAARFSATDTPYVPLCTAFLGAVVALDHFGRAGSRPALALGLGLLTTAMQLRPDGAWLVVPALILFACVPIDRRSLMRPSVLLLAACFLALNAPFFLWAFAGHRPGGAVAPSYLAHFRFVGALFGSPWIDRDASPWPFSLLVVTGAVIACRRRAGALWLLATLVAMPLAEPAIAQYANARYHLPSVYLACGLAGLAVAALLDGVRRLRPALVPEAAVVVLAFVLPPLAVLPRVDLLTRMWTPQLEFERFRAGVRALGRRCVVVTLLDTEDAGFTPFTDPGAADIVDIDAFRAAPLRGACVVYYRAANCVSPEAVRPGPIQLADRCRPFEEDVSPKVISTWTLPALPYRGEHYSRDPIPVGLYRLDTAGDY